MSYDHKSIKKNYNTLHSQRNDFACNTSQKKKFYSLGMFPYPSGNAHMGHVRVYTLSDVRARYEKSKGKEVLHPMGWDSFGLPAENAAIKNKVRPDLWTQENINKMKKDQLNQAGWSFDWDKELNTSSPEYYKWTQWLFLELYKAGKCYRKSDYVNWCPVDKTVLANEQVINGTCWRDGAVVEKKLMEQWFFKITDYAPRLWDDISKLKNWASEAVAVQKNWINKNTGSHIHFEVPDFNETIRVFTTRPDTLFGVTAMVLAPEHPLVSKILEKHPNKKVEDYVSIALRKGQVERMQNKEKTGVPTGVKCLHPFGDKSNLKEIEIWIGDYVIADYGTGAVMCVPAHDTRDYEFAKKFNLQIIEVIKSEDGKSSIAETAFTEDGVLINSSQFDGLKNREAIKNITSTLSENKKGEATTTYQLRDWSVGRQRFWGCPIPIIYCDDCGIVPVPIEQLPVTLPEATDTDMEGGALNLKKFSDWIQTSCPKCSKEARRETDTLDTFLCSSWYALRFIDNKNDNEIFNSTKVNNFMPIDFYVGGLEHAAQHMIYFRFITKFLFDRGLIDFDEPVDTFFCNGMVRKDGSKMSKSKGNVVIPTETIDNFGADAMRLYILSDTPAELDIDWDDKGIKAKQDFIRKNYNSISIYMEKNQNYSIEKGDLKNFQAKELLYDFYGTLNEMSKNLQSNLFNSAVAKVHALSNTLLKMIIKSETFDQKSHSSLKFLIKEFLIATGVIIPLTNEVLLNEYFDIDSLYKQSWPQVDKNYLEKNTVNIAVQINGKKRAIVELNKDCSKDEAFEKVFALNEVKKHTDGKNIIKQIFVPNKIINLVVK